MLSVTTSGKAPCILTLLLCQPTNYLCRLLDKIAKQILVCENKTITPWDGSIGEYKDYLRKKMIAAGAV